MCRYRASLLRSLCALLPMVMAADPAHAQAEKQLDSPARITDLVDQVPATAFGGAGLNYFTGFEPGEGFTPGYIGGNNQPAGCGGVANPCWGVTTNADRSLVEGHINTVHPALGAQHLRLSHDPAARTNRPNYGLGVDARFPRADDLSAQPISDCFVSVDIAISEPGGMSYRIQPQSNSQGFLRASVLFHQSGEIFVLDDLCGSSELAFQSTGFQWDTTGAYQNFSLNHQAGANYMVYSYGNQVIYSGCTIAGTSLDQFLVFGDNYPGSHMDMDDLFMSSTSVCRTVCGDSIINEACEECDGSNDDNCPGRCIAPGAPDHCTCAPICTQANPCPVENGVNGPYITSDGYYTYSGESPSISIDTCGSDFDSLLTVTTVADPGTPLASNDNCNAGKFGAGADKSALCYDGIPPFNDTYPSCACLNNPSEPLLIRVQVISSGPPPIVGYSTTINIRKKSVCEGASVGACCDTNGADQGCTDNVLAADCTGADKVWTDQGKCAEVSCNCIPLCTGLACGPDGCGGSCGNCDDGNACNGSETCNANGLCDPGTPLSCNDGNACNGVESCSPASGCRAGSPLQCNDGQYCNGVETCQPAAGCIPGTPVSCDDSIDCTADSCDEISDSCVHDDSHCAIPAMGEWGLAILALLLLIAAKAFFGLRRPNPA